MRSGFWHRCGPAVVAITVCGVSGATAITLEEYLAAVKATHPLFVRESLESEIAAKHSERFLGDQDWSVDAAPVFRHTEPPQRSPFDPERIDNLRIDAGATRTLWGNGSRIRAYASTDFVDQKVSGFSIPSAGGSIDIPVSPSRFYQHAVGATWSLPLLKNRGGSLDRLEYELSLFDIDASEVAALERQENFVLEMALRFVGWALVDEQLRIARARLGLAESELERTRKKFRANLVDEADVLRAEDAAHLTRNAVLLVEARFRATRAELSTLAGGRLSEDDRPQFDLYDRPGVPGAEDAVREVVDNSRLVRTIDIERARLQRFDVGLGEQSRPHLSLDVGAALVGGADEFDRSLEIKNPDIFVGLALLYPLGNRTAKADIEETYLRSRQLELTRNETVLGLTASLRGILAEMSELDAAVRENTRRIETAEKKTRAEQKLYDQGRGDLTFVIQSRDGEAVARLGLAETSATFQSLALQYRALVDELLSSVDETK